VVKYMRAFAAPFLQAALRFSMLIVRLPVKWRTVILVTCLCVYKAPVVVKEQCAAAFAG
jgi:hypothetical protein